jgi:hypothetical protein
MAYMIPSTAAIPAFVLDVCIDALVTHEFSARLTEYVKASDANRSIKTNVRAKAAVFMPASTYKGSNSYLALLREHLVPETEQTTRRRVFIAQTAHGIWRKTRLNRTVHRAFCRK